MDRVWRKRRSKTGISIEIEGVVSSFSRNISQSGLLCRTSRKIDEMTLLDIKFQLPQVEYKPVEEDVWIECSGVVVRCEKKVAESAKSSSKMTYEVAIFFDRISDRYRSLLARHLVPYS